MQDSTWGGWGQKPCPLSPYPNPAGTLYTLPPAPPPGLQVNEFRQKAIELLQCDASSLGNMASTKDTGPGGAPGQGLQRRSTFKERRAGERGSVCAGVWMFVRAGRCVDMWGNSAAMCGHVWLCVAMCGYVWPCVAICGADACGTCMDACGTC